MFPLHLDENASSNTLLRLLTEAGYDVTTTRGADLLGVDDDVQLEHATTAGRVLVTMDADDFQVIHDQWVASGRPHAGIFAIYLDNDVSRDMTYAQIVAAIANVRNAHGQQQAAHANQFHVLNHYRY